MFHPKRNGHCLVDRERGAVVHLNPVAVVNAAKEIGFVGSAKAVGGRLRIAGARVAGKGAVVAVARKVVGVSVKPIIGNQAVGRHVRWYALCVRCR